MSRNIRILLGLAAGCFIFTVCYKSVTSNPLAAKQNAIATAVEATVPQMEVKAESVQYEFEYDGRVYFSLTCEETGAKDLEVSLTQKEEKANRVQYEFEYDGRAYLSI